jgi:hypothetical protein
MGFARKSSKNKNRIYIGAIKAGNKIEKGPFLKGTFFQNY